MIINETCGGAAAATLNTGGKKQCTPKPIRAYALARKDFAFADLATAKTKAAWDTAKEAKDIVVFWDVNEDPAQNNTEATKKEGRFRDYPLKDGVRGLKLKHYLSDMSYDALQSYDNSLEYTRMFRILVDGNFTFDLQADGTLKGESLANFSVGVLNDTTDETPQNCEVDVKYVKNTKSNAKPDFDLEEYEGIYDVSFTVVSSSATEIVVKADADGAVGSLVQADWKLVKTDGSLQAITGSAYDSGTEQYTLTGVGLVSGTLGTDGVIVQTDIMYQGVDVAITI